MEKITFDLLRNNGCLLYEYIRGSHLYNLNTEKSDIDTSGIYILPLEYFLGLSKNYIPIVKDEKNDNVWYEIRNFCELLIKSNPTILESLFVPNKFIIGKINPLMNFLLENKNEFVSKQCFYSFTSYAIEQINKARGLNKKIVNPIKERLTPLDFIYTFHNNRSIKLNDVLKNYNLKQKYCGLSKINHMRELYNCYYDWASFFIEEDITLEQIENSFNKKDNNDNLFKLIELIYSKIIGEPLDDFEIMKKWYNNLNVLKYKGIINEDKTSNELRLSSIPKNEKPIFFFSYNQDGYTTHCIDYKNYKKWEKERNPIRYESNLLKNYDSKNMAHCVRLIHMGIEIANGEGIILERTWDRELILDIKNHKYKYDELLNIVEDSKNKLDYAIKNSTIKEHIDNNFVNYILTTIQQKFYSKKLF